MGRVPGTLRSRPLAAGVRVCVPTRGRVWYETVTALSGVSPRYYWEKADISRIRNVIARDFLRDEAATTLVMVDDDVVPAPGFVDALLAEDDFDVLGAVYPICFGTKLAPAAWVSLQEGGVDLAPVGTAPAIVDVVGTGCILIRRHVLEDTSLRMPFSVFPDKDGIAVASEDFSFCLRARDAGYRVGVHWGVWCDHVMDNVSAMGLAAGYTPASSEAGAPVDLAAVQR
jgi:hypothetical protein